MAEKTATLYKSALSRDPAMIAPSPLSVSIDLSSTDWAAGDYLIRYFQTLEDGNVQFIGADAADGATTTVYCVKGVQYSWLVRKIVRAGCAAALQANGKIVGGY